MTICKIWVKPFDVLMKNRLANMTSVGCATQLIDDVGSGGGKGGPQLTKEPLTEKKTVILKNTPQNIHSNYYCLLYFQRLPTACHFQNYQVLMLLLIL